MNEGLETVKTEFQNEGEIRCICGFTDDDGFTIQCESCFVWQHAVCVGIKKTDVPDRYFCDKCVPRVLDSELAKVLQKTRVLSQQNGLTPIITSKKPRGRPPTKKKAPNALNSELNGGAEESSASNGNAEEAGFVDEYVKYEECDGCLILDNARQIYEDLNKFNQNAISLMEYYKVQSFSQLHPHPIEIKKIRARGFQKKTAPSKYGVFSMAHLDAGKLVIEYYGELQSKALFGREFAGSHVECTQSFVLFHPSLDLAIDSRKFGNYSRFIRRSCRPNADIRIIFSEEENKIRFGIFSKTMISENEEIMLDLDFEAGNKFFKYDCACSNPEFCLMTNLFNPNLKSTSLNYNDHFYKGRAGGVLEEGEQHQEVPDATDSANSFANETVAEPKKRGRKPKMETLNTSAPASSSESSSSDDDELLSPNSLDQRKLSREERKIQSYMERFQKLESKEKRKKAKRGRPKTAMEERREFSVTSPPYSVASSSFFEIKNPKFLSRKKLLLKAYLNEMESLANSKSQSPDLPKTVVHEITPTVKLEEKPEPEIQTIIEEKEGTPAVSPNNSFSPINNQEPEVEGKSAESVTPNPEPVTPTKTKLSLSQYLMKRKSASQNASSENLSNEI